MIHKMISFSKHYTSIWRSCMLLNRHAEMKQRNSTKERNPGQMNVE